MTIKKNSKRKNRRGRTVLYILVFCFLVIGIAGGYVRSQLEPPSSSGKKVSVNIPSGSSVATIGQQLMDQGLIKNARFFKWYLDYVGKTGQLKAGTFYLTQGMSMDEIINAMVQGNALDNVVKFTIPEGFTLGQMADLLDKEHIVNKEAFLHEADTGTFEYDFVKEIPNTKGMRHRLEGYLFPDTYEVYKNSSAHDVIDIMLKQMNAVLTPEVLAEAKHNGETIHQVLTIASLVEREAKVEQERPVIAGVIKNRLGLNPPMKLQIDATVDYSLGETKAALTYQDLDVDNPYNTYKYAGLPPGPIASPGLPSIEAVLHPTKHDYLYYVTKNDGSGEHYFAATYTEHQQNIAKSQQNAAKGS